MNTTPGVLLVRRVRWWAEGRAKMPRNSAIQLSEDQLTRAYRGIDGTPWPDEIPSHVPRVEGLAPVEYWTQLVGELQTIRSEHIYDAVVLADGPDESAMPPGVRFLGMDVGIYRGEYDVFSSVFHEGIHSPLVELRRYCSRLNGSLLLPTPADADEYNQTREHLRASGRDVEDEECHLIAVFGHLR